MSSSGTWIPQIEALLQQAPNGTNPFAWYAQQLAQRSSPGQAAWAKPIFVIIAVACFLNVPAACTALYLKARRDGGLSFYKLRDHRSGGRYICLNATTTFLFGHILTCLVFGLYALLHQYYYNKPGRSYMDLSWATAMWLAPYNAILLTSIGVVYAVLVAPSPFIDAGKARREGIRGAQSPLASLPCWLLNSFIFLAPTVVTASVLVPAVRLVQAAKEVEVRALEVASSLVTYAKMYAANTAPPAATQAAFLKTVGELIDYSQTASSRWRPVFGLWSAWVALAIAIGIAAFVVVYRVTKARWVFAQHHSAELSEETETFAAHDIFREKPIRQANVATRANHQLVRAARWEHYSLSIQFGMAAILLVVCEIMLLWDTIVGYDVHLKADLLASALIVPPIAYLLHSTTSLVLIMLRAKPVAPQSAAAADSGIVASYGGHSRQNSDDSAVALKRAFTTAAARTVDAGKIRVTSSPSMSYGIGPSIAHHVDVHQTVVVSTDDASALPADDVSQHSSQREQAYLPELDIGRGDFVSSIPAYKTGRAL